MNLQQILQLIQGQGGQPGNRPSGMFPPNPLQSFGNRPSGQFPTNPFPQAAGGAGPTTGASMGTGSTGGGMGGSGGK